MARKRPKPGKKSRRHSLTPRQVKFVRELSKGKSLADAARSSGYTDHRPNQAGYQALEQIQKSAPDLLARHGLTDDTLIDKYLLPLMNANETKFFRHERGKELKILTRNVVAWTPRKDGLDIAMKIRGLYIKEAENKGTQFSVVIINAANRPPWSEMKRAHEVPGEPAP